MVIKENYPFLEYLMTNYGTLEQVEDFYNVIGFVNKLMKEVQNKKTREEAEKITVKELLEEIRRGKGEATP